jgi:hypothetical protein
MSFGFHDPQNVVVVGPVAIPVGNGGVGVDVEIDVRIEERDDASAGTLFGAGRDFVPLYEYVGQRSAPAEVLGLKLAAVCHPGDRVDQTSRMGSLRSRR